MKKGLCVKAVIIAVMVCVFVLSVFVYLKSYLFHLTVVSTGIVELIAYLVGYIMTELCLCSAVYEIALDRKHTASLWLVFACMAIRFVYDLFTVLSDGFALPGLLSMRVFLALDLLMLGCTLMLIRKERKATNIFLAVLTAVYLVGEVAGYPIQTFDDIDEFVLMLNILAVVIVPMISHGKRGQGDDPQ